MKRSSIFSCVMVVVSLIAVATIKLNDSGKKCDFDGSEINVYKRVHIESSNNVKVEFCSISCAKSWIENHPELETELQDGTANLSVVDEIYGEEIDGSLAYWVQSEKFANRGNNDRYHVFKDAGDAATHIDLYKGRELPGLLAGLGEKLNWAKKFKTVGLDGKIVAMSDFKDKVLFIRFWSALNPYVMEDFSYLAESQKRWEKDGLVVLAINVDQGRDVVESVVKDMGLPFVILMDENGEIADNYGVKGFPTGFVVDRTGIIRNQSIGEILPELMEPLIGPYL